MAAANTLLYQNLLSFDPTLDAKPWDIPAEREAMIVSKSVAESLMGQRAVMQFAEAQIAANNDVEKWKFFMSLTPSDTCNLIEGTDQFGPKIQGTACAGRGGSVFVGMRRSRFCQQPLVAIGLKCTD